jgi:hypothetical protein
MFAVYYELHFSSEPEYSRCVVRPLRSPRAAVLVVSIATVLVGAIGPTTSSAWTANGSGHWGPSTVPPFQATVRSFQGSVATIPARRVNAARAYRGPQLITNFWSIYSVVNSGQPCSPCQNPYSFYTGTQSTVGVPQGGYATFQARSFALAPYAAYTFNFTTIWRTTRGKLIGRRNIYYVSLGDYQCFTSGRVACAIENVNGRAAVYVEDV